MGDCHTCFVGHAFALWNEPHAGLLVDFLILEDLIQEVLPDLAAHMREHGVDANMLLAAPMMSLCVGSCPCSAAQRTCACPNAYGVVMSSAGETQATFPRSPRSGF